MTCVIVMYLCVTVRLSHLQSVMSSAQSLSDITDERVVPVDYLGVLILLFMFMVLDRLFYTLGLHIGKVTDLSFLHLPCTLPYPATCLALSCSLPCPALPCPALPCPALVSSVKSCHIISLTS